MNTTELFDDYVIEVAKKVLDDCMPEAVYDDIAVVPVGNTPYFEVYFINHPQYYKVKVEILNGPSDDSRANHFAA
jgi:hypothetical protein